MNYVQTSSLKLRITYILELTVGYETNLNSYSERKHEKYRNLIKDKEKSYNKVKFVNVSISSLGVFGQSTNSLIDMFKDLKFEEQHIKYIIRKIIATCTAHLIIYSVCETKIGLVHSF